MKSISKAILILQLSTIVSLSAHASGVPAVFEPVTSSDGAVTARPTTGDNTYQYPFEIATNPSVATNSYCAAKFPNKDRNEICSGYDTMSVKGIGECELLKAPEFKIATETIFYPNTPNPKVLIGNEYLEYNYLCGGRSSLYTEVVEVRQMVCYCPGPGYGG